MDVRPLFALQFLVALAAWGVIAWRLLPSVRKLDRHTQLSVWVAPHMFRVLGVGLLVPNLNGPGMPQDFAWSTAIGDTTTSVLAIFSLVALRKWPRAGIVGAWAWLLVGLGDLCIALVLAARLNVAIHLHAQWFVPTFCVPVMLVTHMMGLRVLLQVDGKGDGG